jgi:hypothetical protein
MTITATDDTGAKHVARVPCYYLRIWVENLGRTTATDVHVFAAALRKKTAAGVYAVQDHFLPMNLKWAHSGEVLAKSLAPHMGKHCDVAHVCKPGPVQTEDGSGALTLAAPPGLPPDKPQLTLELEVPPATMTHTWPQGEYELDLKIAAANAAPNGCRLRIRLGEWCEDEATRLTSGLAFVLV